MGNRRENAVGSTRRDFLKASGLGAAALNLGHCPAFALAPAERSVIFLMMVGGPSQLETFDPKPSAPSEIRGPFRAIETAVPGVRINEYLPKIAQQMDRLALIRTLHHDSSPIHETGFQLLQTGRLCRQQDDYPNLGARATNELGRRGSLPSWMILPGPLSATGVAISHGQSAAGLGLEFEPFLLNADPASPVYEPAAILNRARGLSAHEVRNPFKLANEPAKLRDEYGRSSFGQNCLLARKLVESGVRMITVNMFETVFEQPTWDCHGRAPFSTFTDYRESLLPNFDRAFSALINDLDRVGRLDSTLVVATGEFGRTPKLNNEGGRDHWPAAWSALVAGGGIPSGQVIGKTDAHTSEPIERPVRPEELLATIARHLGMSAGSIEGFEPIAELIA